MAKHLKLKWALNLEQTLLGGQSFRWSQSGENFIGVFSNIVWKLRLSERKLYYEILGELPYPDDINSIRIKVPKPKSAAKGKLLYQNSYYEQLLREYFRFDISLDDDYSFWIEAHKHFESKASKDKPLVTQLNQDIIETIFAFICSQNNHINRISSLVEKLCINYGEKICMIDDRDFYNFPSLEMLTRENDMESKLREMGFGYRAKYIEKAANEIIKMGGLVWLNNLSTLKYTEAHEQLIKLPGIGPKVSDCICLMALNFLEAVPIDTHILQIAQHYLSEDLSKVKSMNLTFYRKIGDTFRKVYGAKAGIAQTVLFCQELNKFSNDPGEALKKKRKVT